MNTRRATHAIATGSLAVMCITASAVYGQSLRTVVTEDGVFTVQGDSTSLPTPIPGARAALPASGGGWTHQLPSGIGETVAFSPAHTWAGVRLNNERMIAFETAGTGSPLYEVPTTGDSPAGVAAARGADRAAYYDVQNGSFRVRAYTSADSNADWQHAFGSNYNQSNALNVAVSRDGAIVAAGAHDTAPDESVVIFFNADTGDQISTWTQTGGTLAAIDLTDDGSLAMVSIGDEPHVVDTATGTTIWSGDGSGAGNVDYRISGDGNVIAVGGFDLEIYQWDGSTYQQIIEVDTGPLEWFGFGVAISGDGSTVGAMSREISSETMNVRLWDVQSQQMIGEVTLPGVAGSLQTAPQGADATDDGSRFAFATWSDGTGEYAEVQVYDDELNMVGEIDMPGSAFDVAISADGQWVAGAGKAVHANDLGSGGQVAVTEFDVAVPGDLDGDGSVGVNDLLQLLGAWGDCDDPDNCPEDLDGDGAVGVNDLLTLLGNWG